MEIRGINHLAMVTGDMDGTVRFYQEVLGLPVVATTGNKPGSYPYRHYFFKLGPHSTLAFFEWPGMVEPFHKPAGQPARGRLQFDHLSFDVPDEDTLLALRQRLESHAIEVTPVVDHQFIQSIYFTDPTNGIALEATYWVKDPTEVEPDLSDSLLFGDPDPVPSLRGDAQPRPSGDQEAISELSRPLLR